MVKDEWLIKKYFTTVNPTYCTTEQKYTMPSSVVFHNVLLFIMKNYNDPKLAILWEPVIINLLVLESKNSGYVLILFSVPLYPCLGNSGSNVYTWNTRSKVL